jgi:hypothetical protein
MDLPDHPTDPHQIFVSERQLFQGEYAFHELDDMPALSVAAEGRWDINPSRAERAEIGLNCGCVLQPRFSDGVAFPHNTLRSIPTR